MPYVLPTFNVAVNVWHGGNAPPAPPDLVTVGNLTPGRRTLTPYALEPAGAQIAANMHLLLPPATDVRDSKAASGNDLVEVPAGSGRLYDVLFVDDIGFGFANEHRFAQLAGKGPWPVPFPSGVPAIVTIGGGTCATATNFFRNTWYRTNIPAFVVQHWWILANPLPIPTNYTLVLLGAGWNVIPANVQQGLCAGPNINLLVAAPQGTFNPVSVVGLANEIRLVTTGDPVLPFTVDFWIGP